MDAATLRISDSPVNRERFGAEGSASGKVARYPQVQAVTVTSIPAHLVADMNVGCHDTKGTAYAKRPAPVDRVIGSREGNATVFWLPKRYTPR